jgi:hypothetical protein
MRRFLFQLVLLGVMFTTRFDGFGFALSGPSMPYQVALGPGGSPHAFAAYRTVLNPQARDEEYRWNVPVITYGFDQPFFNYFGTNGINSIEENFKILNNLPPVSQITDQVLSNYLFSVEDVNAQAIALRIIDLKSYAMPFILEHCGLAEPETYVWSARSRTVYSVGDTSFTNYTVIARNYDPITRFPSPVVNGVTYTYTVQGDFLTVLPFFSSTAVSGITGFQSRTVWGHSFWGLTYDDVGCFRQIYATNNFNMERVLPSLILRSAATGGGGGSGAFTGSIWDGPFVSANGVVSGGIWDGTLTSSTTNALAGGTPATNTATTGLFNGVSVGLRGGLDKITFVRVNFDSLLGQGFLALTNNFGDQFITNGVIRTQQVGRLIFTPDIMFRAADLGLTGVGLNRPVSSTAYTVPPINDYDINIPASSLAGAGPDGPNEFINGPGILSPGNEYIFSSLLPWYYQETTGPTDGPNAFNGARGAWGTFDSVSVKTIYPSFMNLQISDLELLVQQSQLQQ